MLNEKDETEKAFRHWQYSHRCAPREATCRRVAAGITDQTYGRAGNSSDSSKAEAVTPRSPASVFTHLSQRPVLRRRERAVPAWGN